MCIKAGADELESVKNLMSMALKAVVAESLGVELEDIEDSSHLVRDLRMTPATARELRELIADTFDGLSVNLDSTPTYGTLLEYVVLREFHDVEAAVKGSDLAA